MSREKYAIIGKTSSNILLQEASFKIIDITSTYDSVKEHEDVLDPHWRVTLQQWPAPLPDTFSMSFESMSFYYYFIIIIYMVVSPLSASVYWTINLGYSDTYLILKKVTVLADISDNTWVEAKIPLKNQYCTLRKLQLSLL